MAEEKPTWRRKSTGASRYAKMLALGASLITGAPKTNPNADAPAAQEKIQNVAQKPTDGVRAPSLPDNPTTGADQIKGSLPQALPQENVDDVLQGVGDDDDRRDNTHDARRHEREQNNKNKNNNQNQGNTDSSPQSPHKPRPNKSSQLPTTQPATGSGIRGAAQAAESEAKHVAKQALQKIAKEAIKKAAVAVWTFILANLEWIIPVVIGLIVALMFLNFIVYVYCLFPPSPCGKAGNMMSDPLNPSDYSNSQTTQERSGLAIIADTKLGSDIATLANSQVGMGEPGPAGCGPLKFYPNSKCPSKTNDELNPWCADFATWVIANAGGKIPHIRSARGVENFYQKANRWSSKPAVGDAYTITRGGGSGRHVGIVIGVNGGTLTVVDGNWSNKVSRYNRPAATAVGFGAPYK